MPWFRALSQLWLALSTKTRTSAWTGKQGSGAAVLAAASSLAALPMGLHELHMVHHAHQPMGLVVRSVPCHPPLSLHHSGLHMQISAKVTTHTDYRSTKLRRRGEQRHIYKATSLS